MQNICPHDEIRDLLTRAEQELRMIAAAQTLQSGSGSGSVPQPLQQAILDVLGKVALAQDLLGQDRLSQD